MSAINNRTLTVTSEEQKLYLSRCIPESRAAGSDTANAVYYGDMHSVCPQLPLAFADLLIADPPYNISKTYSANTFNRISDKEYRRFTAEWIEHVKPLLKANASVYVCCDWRSGLIIGDVLQEYFTVRSRITWQREKGRGAAKNWKNSLEDIWFATCSQDYYFNLDTVKLRRSVIAPYRKDGKPKDWCEHSSGGYRDTCPSNFWDDITIPFWSMPENTVHPTQKPEKLLAKLILASCPQGGTVLDPFLGSGSSAVTASKLGRIYTGIEREELYCALAQKRLELAKQDKRIQGYEDGVFYERNYKVKR